VTLPSSSRQDRPAHQHDRHRCVPLRDQARAWQASDNPASVRQQRPVAAVQAEQLRVRWPVRAGTRTRNPGPGPGHMVADAGAADRRERHSQANERHASAYVLSRAHAPWRQRLSEPRQSLATGCGPGCPPKLTSTRAGRRPARLSGGREPMAAHLGSRARRLIITAVLAGGLGAGATGVALASTSGSATHAGSATSTATTSSASTSRSASTAAASAKPKPSATHHCTHMSSSPPTSGS
jgi:hypothetical protein